MIGVLDSGIGGLSVVSALNALLPNHDLVYFGDTAHAPYGVRSPERIRQCADRSIHFMRGRGVRILVTACNTISSLGADYLERRCGLPVVDAVGPAVLRSVKESRRGCIGLIGSPATIASRAHEKRIHAILPRARVYARSAPLVGPLVESGMLRRPETRMIVKKYLHPLKTKRVDTLILACSHLTVMGREIQRRMGKQVRLVDSVAVLAEAVRSYLEAHEELDRSLGKSGLREYFLSDVTDDIRLAARRVFGCGAALTAVDPGGG